MDYQQAVDYIESPALPRGRYGLERLKQALELLVKACPAGLYKKQDDGSVRFDYAGCLECGTCRILGLGSALEQWEYPRGTFGVEFRYG